MPHRASQLSNMLGVSTSMTTVSLLGLSHVDQPTYPKLPTLAFAFLINGHGGALAWQGIARWCKAARPCRPQPSSRGPRGYDRALAPLG